MQETGPTSVLGPIPRQILNLKSPPPPTPPALAKHALSLGEHKPRRPLCTQPGGSRARGAGARGGGGLHRVLDGGEAASWGRRPRRPQTLVDACRVPAWGLELLLGQRESPGAPGGGRNEHRARAEEKGGPSGHQPRKAARRQ